MVTCRADWRLVRLGYLGPAYLKGLVLEFVSQLPQKFKVLGLRPCGHTQARGRRNLTKISRRQSSQLVEVERSEGVHVILYNFKLQRCGFGEHVGIRGHLV
jgi:hypothetical protein